MTEAERIEPQWIGPAAGAQLGRRGPEQPPQRSILPQPQHTGSAHRGRFALRDVPR